MTITDGDVAALAERAAVLAPLPVRVKVEPGAGDDPYRWGTPYWLVRFTTEDGRTAAVRVTAEDSEADADARLTEALTGLAGR